MDSIDKAILTELQNDFPLEENPYDIVARRLKVDVNNLWNRINNLIDTGIIRRLGTSINSHKFGFKSTLAAISVGEDSIDRAAKLIEKFPEITHCYLRNHRFNIWFTVIAVDEKRIKDVLEMIRLDMSLSQANVLNLPIKRLFKLDARFNAES